ncbi:GNAT family N-acetyltransferase [Metabacillus sp. KIGAM252]|uniref:GNAT family N-acetyltransferase n=1 Tax=Metabacillus flavus TaxID=2823519 RepID=A0ABS5LAT6_9BACI|nr:GNAT family N-acetyltransferase [Metabacillus flavus]MBS2967754.1 GNAT family N-acetyltransferase [Metabacillus flavus]
MKISKASIKDAAAIATLFNAYRMFYSQPSDLEGAFQFLKDRLEKEESVIYLAEDDHGAAGFVQLYPSFTSVGMRRIWILNDLYVAEHARSKGVGQKLIDHAVELCRETGAKAMNLETAVTNRSAQRLYEKNSFVKTEDCFFYSLKI